MTSGSASCSGSRRLAASKCARHSSHLRARTPRRLGKVKASHEWQYSTDGGKTWTSVQTTLQAKTTVPGLQPGNTVVFRHRAVTKSGPVA